MASRKMLARLWIAAMAGTVVSACGGGEEGGESTAGAPAAETSPATSAPAAGGAGGGAAEGQQIFAGAGLCMTCHGPGGTGTALAPNLTDAQWVNFPSRPTLEEVVTLIKTGVPTPKEHPAPMPPMGGAQLTDEQVRAVATYVLSLSGG